MSYCRDWQKDIYSSSSFDTYEEERFAKGEKEKKMNEQEKGEEEELDLVCGNCEFWKANGICYGFHKIGIQTSVDNEMCVIGKAYAGIKIELGKEREKK